MKECNGKPFYATIFGRRWLFLFDPKDMLAVLKSPEKKISMLTAAYYIGGFAFPNDRRQDYSTQEAFQKIASRNGQGPSGTPHIIHSIRKEKRLAWLPAIRQVLQQCFDKLPEQGSVELFSWCQHLIINITVRVLLGEFVLRDQGLLETFANLFYEGDPEVGFQGPLKSFASTMECFVFGERRVFGKVRELLYPYVDEEIQRLCIDKVPESDDESVLQTFVRMWYKKVDQDVDLLRQARRRIVNDVFLFSFAAFTNSYAGSAWVLYHCLRNTSGVGNEIRQEVERIPKDNAVHELDCPVLEMTVLEISRLYTPGNLNPSRLDHAVDRSNNSIGYVY